MSEVCFKLKSVVGTSNNTIENLTFRRLDFPALGVTMPYPLGLDLVFLSEYTL